MDKSPKEKSSKQERDVEKNGGEETVMSNAEKRASILMRKNGGKVPDEPFSCLYTVNRCSSGPPRLFPWSCLPGPQTGLEHHPKASVPVGTSL